MIESSTCRFLEKLDLWRHFIFLNDMLSRALSDGTRLSDCHDGSQQLGRDIVEKRKYFWLPEKLVNRRDDFLGFLLHSAEGKRGARSMTSSDINSLSRRLRLSFHIADDTKGGPKLFRFFCPRISSRALFIDYRRRAMGKQFFRIYDGI